MYITYSNTAHAHTNATIKIYMFISRDESRTPADSHTHTPSTRVKVTFFVCFDKDICIFCLGFYFQPCIFSHISLLIRLKADVRHCAQNKNLILHSRKILLDNYTAYVCTIAGIQTKFRPLKMSTMLLGAYSSETTYQI